MHGPSDEMSFQEFKDLMATLGETSGALKRFSELLESGCSEADAKRWLVEHISELPEHVQHAVMDAVAEDLLKQADEPALTDAQIKRGFLEIWKRHGFFAAIEFVNQQQRKRGHRNG
jgi:hypothetical protein